MIFCVLLIVVLPNTQIKLYDGNSYFVAIKKTLLERHIVEYLQTFDTFDEYYSFIWMIL